jgi:hypothetical protein
MTRQEEIARIIAPSVAAMFDDPKRDIYGDSYAYNVWRNCGRTDWQEALAKADAIIELFAAPEQPA